MSLKNGIQQPVNKIYGAIEGELKTFVYTGNNQLKDAVDQRELQQDERLITLYFPPGYDQTKAEGYHFQVVLDGEQYLSNMQMNSIFDNLITSRSIEPAVIAFISPYTGAPDPLKKGLPPVTPAGYSIAQRFKEYSCNPVFAERMSRLPDLVRQKFNITSDPEKTSIWGLSMGGLQAIYTTLIYPETFRVVVAQSPMAWNIPEQNGADWREKITEDWTTSTALLPNEEQHNEYLSQMVKSGTDVLSGRSLNPEKPIRFYFDAGSAEEKYDPEPGFANLVEATRILSRDLREQGHSTSDVVIIPGGHNTMTWMADIADVAKSVHAVPIASKVTEAGLYKQQNKDDGVSNQPSISTGGAQLSNNRDNK